jgi:hypothetical protein
VRLHVSCSLIMFFYSNFTHIPTHIAYPLYLQLIYITRVMVFFVLLVLVLFVTSRIEFPICMIIMRVVGDV